MLTPAKTIQRSAYLEFVSQGQPEEIERFYSLKTCRRFSAVKPEIPESKVLAPDAEKVIASVCDYYRIPRSELLVSKRGTENPPRDMEIFWSAACVA